MTLENTPNAIGSQESEWIAQWMDQWVPKKKNRLKGAIKHFGKLKRKPPYDITKNTERLIDELPDDGPQDDY